MTLRDLQWLFEEYKTPIIAVIASTSLAVVAFVVRLVKNRREQIRAQLGEVYIDAQPSEYGGDHICVFILNKSSRAINIWQVLVETDFPLPLSFHLEQAGTDIRLEEGQRVECELQKSVIVDQMKVLGEDWLGWKIEYPVKYRVVLLSRMYRPFHWSRWFELDKGKDDRRQEAITPAPLFHTMVGRLAQPERSLFLRITGRILKWVWVLWDRYWDKHLCKVRVVVFRSIRRKGTAVLSMRAINWARRPVPLSKGGLRVVSGLWAESQILPLFEVDRTLQPGETFYWQCEEGHILEQLTKKYRKSSTFKCQVVLSTKEGSESRSTRFTLGNG